MKALFIFGAVMLGVTLTGCGSMFEYTTADFEDGNPFIKSSNSSNLTAISDGDSRFQGCKNAAAVGREIYGNVSLVECDCMQIDEQLYQCTAHMRN